MTKKNIKTRNPEENENENETENEKPFKEGADICQQLLDRYSKSSAPQHRHLLATAVAMRSIISAESLPLSPPAYFAAAISTIEDSQSLDPTATGALLAFLSIVIPVLPKQGIATEKADKAVEVLAGMMEKEDLSAACVRNAVKCLGLLLVGFCNLGDWNSVQLGFQELLKFSVDKRPKVRRCSQECLENVFKSFQFSTVINGASKSVLSLVKKYMDSAVYLSSVNAENDYRIEMLSNLEQLEVLHMLNVLKLTASHLSAKVSSKTLSELRKLIGSEHSPLTANVIKTIEFFLGNPNVQAFLPDIENIILSLSTYVSLGRQFPVETVMFASTLMVRCLDKLHSGKSNSWIKNIPIVSASLSGLLMSKDSVASHGSVILKELISHHVDPVALSIGENQSLGEGSHVNEGSSAVQAICANFEHVLDLCDRIPNKYLLAVISVLFLKLGKTSYNFMQSILLKLAKLMASASGEMPHESHLEECIGSAVFAIGVEKILTILPISIQENDFICHNVWLLPILKDYVVGAPLGFYMDHIVPLGKSFQQASRKAKRRGSNQDLLAHAHELWGLLPGFCRYPTDTHKKFGALAKLLVDFLNKHSFMHQDIAVALQMLVNQNKSALGSENDHGESNTFAVKNSMADFLKLPPYSKKIASRNIKAMAACSAELLQALMDVYIDSSQQGNPYLKDAIGCLASVSDSSITKKAYISILEKLQSSNYGTTEETQGRHSDTQELTEEQGNPDTTEKDLERGTILALASSLIEGASEDLIDLIYNLIQQALQATDDVHHNEAYIALRRILEKHAWFVSTRFVELIELLLSLKPPVHIEALRNRFECFNRLMVYALKTRLEEESLRPFLILNEIILTLKDGKEEHRKAAYNILLKVNSSLRSLSDSVPESLPDKFISMIMGYLSGSSPHIKSGAISALSVLIHNDPEISLSKPDLVSSLLSLLQSNSVEVIKAVLGFVKVLVSSLQADELNGLLPDVIRGVIPFSSVSRNHFRSKVTIILEIMMRKCGPPAIKLVTPERYKGFINKVIENRRGKTSSKGTETNDLETMIADSSDQGSKHQEPDIQSKRNESEQRKRKREKKYGVGLPKSSNPHESVAGAAGLKSRKSGRYSKKSVKGQLDQVEGGNFHKRRLHTDARWNNKSSSKGQKSIGKRKMEQAGIGKNGREGNKTYKPRPKKVRTK